MINASHPKNKILKNTLKEANYKCSQTDSPHQFYKGPPITAQYILLV